MRINDKTKEQLIEESAVMRQRITELEKLETERRKTEESLKESEKRFRVLFEQAAVGVAQIISETGQFVRTNQKYCDIVGYSLEEMGNLTFQKITHPDDLQEDLNNMKLLIKGEIREFSMEKRYFHKNGSIVWVNLAVSPMWKAGEKPDYHIAVVEDITKRKKAEEALCESKDKFRTYYDKAPMGYQSLDDSGCIIDVNDTWLETLQYSRDEVLGRSFGDFLAPAYIDKFRENFPCFKKSGEVLGIEFEMIHKDGSHRLMAINGRVSYDEKGEFNRTHCILNDITEYKKAEERIKKQQYYLEKAQEIGAIGTWELDIVRNVLIWTDQNYRNFGVPLGTPLTYEIFLDRVHPDDREYVNAEWMAAIKGNPYDIEHRLIINGKIRWVREKADVTFDEEGNGVYAIGFTQDITKRKLMEEEIKKHRDSLNELVSERTAELENANEKLRLEINERSRAEAEALQASHMAALGELAAGVAHEINNPINGVINYSQILYNRSRDGSKEEEIAGKIIKESDRVAGIVHNLLSFARDGREKKSPVQVHEIITSTVGLSKALLKKDGIIFKVNIPPNLPQVIAHTKQMIVVFLNIISNARYALNHKYNGRDGKKNLEITAVKRTVEGRPFIRVAFYDNGEGIPASITDRILNPFFSTKPANDGTGLGLSISHSIINDHGGKLFVESVEGEYTKVMVDLPLRQG